MRHAVDRAICLLCRHGRGSEDDWVVAAREPRRRTIQSRSVDQTGVLLRGERVIGVYIERRPVGGTNPERREQLGAIRRVGRRRGHQSGDAVFLVPTQSGDLVDDIRVVRSFTGHGSPPPWNAHGRRTTGQSRVCRTRFAYGHRGPLHGRQPWEWLAAGTGAENSKQLWTQRIVYSPWYAARQPADSASRSR